jgi:hypothetical protein
MLHMRKPTTINAAEVAWGGTTSATGEKNSATKKRSPVTSEANPLRPPSETPAALSM